MDSQIAAPIGKCIENWHRTIEAGFADGLDEILHEDCVFLSPIVFTPQEGRELTKAYLMAAGATLTAPATAPGESSGQGSFHYVKEVLDGCHAVLEFETTVGDKYVNGIDMITCDEDSKITEFKVMIRPLQAVNLMHASMMKALEELAAADQIS